MPIVLFRVDERLIHGQVVVGWGEQLHADRIIVVDDELHSSAWEQELYCLGVPPEVDASFVNIDQARREFGNWRTDARRTIVLLRDLDSLRRLAAGRVVAGEEINLGGLHHGANRRRVLPYLFLDTRDFDALREVAGEGGQITARDLPNTRPVSLDDLLKQDEDGA